MKKTLAIAALIAALAAPLSAQAHRAWMIPSSTTLSGSSAWIGVDAGMSNGVFVADHAAMRLDGLTITAPDGSRVEPQNLMRGRLRQTFDVELTQPGTYRIANVIDTVVASYKLNGETARWRGAPADYPAALPAGATEVEASHTQMRVETFATLGQPNETAFASSGAGIEMVPVTHPTDLVAGEAATFRLMKDGRPAAGLEVTIARGGSRYRDTPDEMTVRTDAEGAFTVTWPEPGMYWMNAAVRTPAQGERLAVNAQYNAVVEVLP